MRRRALLAVGLRFHVKMLTRSSFFLLTSVVQPLIFATVAFYMFQRRRPSRGRSSTRRSAPG